MTFLVTTTQRCGSTFLTRILERMADTTCAYLNCIELGFALRHPSSAHCCTTLAEAIADRGTRVLKTHDLPSKDFDDVTANIPEVRILTLHRDFKDVVVSRFFYYRYYWPSDKTLGPLPGYLRKFFEPLSSTSDREAMRKLLSSPVLIDWAEEWASFEGSFSTKSAIRLTYEQLTQEELPPIRTVLEHFTGLRWHGIASFETRQASETEATGRTGNARFNREGRCGQYVEWFNPGQIQQLDAVAAAAMRLNRNYNRKADPSAHKMP